MEDKDIEAVGEESTDDKAVELSSKSEEADKKSVKKKVIYLLATVGLAAFFCSFYYCSLRVPGIFFPVVMFSYMITLTVLMIVYIVYNRGFSRKGVTEEMLPPEWTQEQKVEFIESGRVRLQRSKWILVFIIAILFTFIVEAFVLFVF